MHKSILVLEESPMVHELFESALPKDYWSWNIDHESQPGNYVSRVTESKPDIILLSNLDQKKDYAVVRQIRAQDQFDETPILLLTSAKDRLDVKKLQELGVQGFIRKPFESSTLQEQIESVLKNQGKLSTVSSKPELEKLNVIDDELLDLLSGKDPHTITLDSLEAELDPTLQLHPIEAVSILEADGERIEKFETTEYLDGEEEEGFQNLDIQPESEPAEEVDLDDVEAEEAEKRWEKEIAETQAIEIELEEISLDLEDEPAEAPIPADEQSPGGLLSIPIIPSSQPQPKACLLNEAEDNDIGLMEIEVIPFEQPQPTAVDDDIVNDLDAFGEVNETEEIGEESELVEPVEAYSDLEVAFADDDDSIEIEHTEIADIQDDGFVEGHGRDFDETELMEISVEGMDEIELEETDDKDTQPDGDVEIDEEETDESAPMTLAGEDDGTDFEIDFEQELEAFEKEDAAKESPEDLTAGPDDLDLSEFETLDAASAQMNIQEMINFRQVTKAKYDIPELTAEESSTEDDIDLLSEDEIDDFNLADDADLDEKSEETENLETDFEEIEIKDWDTIEDLEDAETLADETDEITDPFQQDTGDFQDIDDEAMEDQTGKTEEIALMSEEELDAMSLEDLDVDAMVEDIEQLAEASEGENDQDLDQAAEDSVENAEQDLDLDFEPSDDIEQQNRTEASNDDLFSDDLESSSGEAEELLSMEEGEDSDDLFMDDLDVDDEIEDTETDGQIFADEPSTQATDGEEDAITEAFAETTSADGEAFSDELTIEGSDQPIDLLSDDMGETESVEDLFSDEIPSSETETEPVSETSPPAKETRFKKDSTGSTSASKTSGKQPVKETAENDPDDLFSLPLDDEMDETGPDIALGDSGETSSLDTDSQSIGEAEEVIIEVPQDVFEMGDFKMDHVMGDQTDGDFLEEEPEDDAGDQETLSTPESAETIELPSLDEDLPDLPVFMKAETPVPEDTVTDSLTDEEESIELIPDKSSSIGQNIELLQQEDDFEPFADTKEPICFDSTVSDLKPEPDAKPITARKPIERKTLSKDQKQLLAQSENLRNRLSSMIEGIIAETIQSTLHEMLPEMMEKIMEEELQE